jgi:hypothetical protein
MLSTMDSGPPFTIRREHFVLILTIEVSGGQERPMGAMPAFRPEKCDRERDR